MVSECFFVLCAKVHPGPQYTAESCWWGGVEASELASWLGNLRVSIVKLCQPVVPTVPPCGGLDFFTVVVQG